MRLTISWQYPEREVLEKRHLRGVPPPTGAELWIPATTGREGIMLRVTRVVYQAEADELGASVECAPA